MAWDIYLLAYIIRYGSFNLHYSQLLWFFSAGAFKNLISNCLYDSHYIIYIYIGSSAIWVVWFSLVTIVSHHRTSYIPHIIIRFIQYDCVKFIFFILFIFLDIPRLTGIFISEFSEVLTDIYSPYFTYFIQYWTIFWCTRNLCVCEYPKAREVWCICCRSDQFFVARAASPCSLQTAHK